MNEFILFVRFVLLVAGINLIAYRNSHPDNTDLWPLMAGAVLMLYMLLGRRDP